MYNWEYLAYINTSIPGQFKYNIWPFELILARYVLNCMWHTWACAWRTWTTVCDGHLSTEPSWGPVIRLYGAGQWYKRIITHHWSRWLMICMAVSVGFKIFQDKFLIGCWFENPLQTRRCPIFWELRYCRHKQTDFYNETHILWQRLSVEVENTDCRNKQ